MKSNMNLALHKPSLSASVVDCVFQAIQEFINDLKARHTTFKQNVAFCRKLRTDRKLFEKAVAQLIVDFGKISKNVQRDIELALYKAINKLESIVPSVYADLDQNAPLFMRLFLKREIRQTLKSFRKYQKTMSDILYPDRKQEILDSPALYQSIVDAWGDLADED